MQLMISSATMTDPDVSWYYGPCPLITCQASVSHGHLSCPNCGAVQFRNPACPVCCQAWNGIPDKDEPRIVPVNDIREVHRSVTCPRCGSGPHELCVGVYGRTVYEHRARVTAAIARACRTVGEATRG